MFFIIGYLDAYYLIFNIMFLAIHKILSNYKSDFLLLMALIIYYPYMTTLINFTLELQLMGYFQDCYDLLYLLGKIVYFSIYYNVHFYTIFNYLYICIDLYKNELAYSTPLYKYII